jgi:hypothetical protein
VVLAVGGRTTNAYMIGLINAQYIRKYTGLIVPPWEAIDMPVDWMDAIKAFYEDVPRKAEIINKAKPKKR